MPALTLAKRLYLQYPGQWATEDAAYSCVRRQLGIAGKRSKQAENKREPREAGDNWERFLPGALSTIRSPWKPHNIAGPTRALLLSDIHIPFYHKAATERAIRYGIENGADTVVLNGDILDVYSLSDFVRNPMLRDLPGEIWSGRMFLKAVRKAFPNAKIIYKWGNHEERYEKHLRAKGADFYGVDCLEWERVFEYRELEIADVRDKRPIRLGKLNVIHGHEYGSGFSDPVSPARTFFLRAGVNTIGGHYHRSSHFTKKNLPQKVITCWSTGALCEEHPDYRPVNDWNLGFAFVEVNKSGAFRVNNLRYIDGELW